MEGLSLTQALIPAFRETKWAITIQGFGVTTVISVVIVYINWTMQQNDTFYTSAARFTYINWYYDMDK